MLTDDDGNTDSVNFFEGANVLQGMLCTSQIFVNIVLVDGTTCIHVLSIPANTYKRIFAYVNSQ